MAPWAPLPYTILPEAASLESNVMTSTCRCVASSSTSTMAEVRLRTTDHNDMDIQYFLRMFLRLLIRTVTKRCSLKGFLPTVSSARSTGNE